ncbi:MAG TPA: protein kinase [Solirubrobacteraceae bacterium]
MLAVGDTLAGYKLEELVGSGATGVMFRARDRRLGRDVALRVVAPDLASDPLVRARVNRESTVLAHLDHPNVVPLYAAEEAGGTICLVSRWVDGRSLRRIVDEDGPLEPGRAVRLVVQVAGALQTAHELDIIHRDVKPSNVLVTSADHAYLTDFCLARRSTDVTGLTAPNELVAALDYVAPELISGEDVDARIDIYGLGLVLFEALTGEVPFSRTGDAAKLYAHLVAEPPSVHQRRPEVPPELDRVIARALAKRPQERQPTPTAFARAVVDAAGATRPPWTRDRDAPAPAPAPAADDDANPPTLKRSEPFRPGADLQALRQAARAPSGPFSERRRLSVDTPARAGDAGPTPGRAPRRTRRLVGALALLGLFLAPPVTLLLILRDREAGPITRTGAGPARGLAVAGGHVWVATAGTNTLEAFSTARGGRRRAVALGAGVIRGVASRGDHLLVATDRALVDLPHADSARATRVAVRDRIGPLAVGGGSSWAGVTGRAVLLRLAAGRITRIPLRAPASALSVAAGTLWVAHARAGTVFGVDTTTRVARTAKIHVGRRPVAIAATRRAVWVVCAGDSTIVRLDPQTGRVTGAPVPVPDGPNSVAADSREVWVTRRRADAVTQINARTGRPQKEVNTATAPVRVALTDHVTWVVGSDGQVTRIPR